MDRLEGVGKKSDQCVPQIRLLRKIAYGEIYDFVQEKKVHIVLKYYKSILTCDSIQFDADILQPHWHSKCSSTIMSLHWKSPWFCP